MNIVIHLYVCLFVCIGMKESCTFMKLQCIFTYFVHFSYIMLYYVVWGQSALVYQF